MPTKVLESPFSGRGNPFSYGGGANTVLALDPNPIGTTGYEIDGGGGNDSLYGSSLDDILTGGTGNDTVYGGAGTDTIRGGETDGSDKGKGKGVAAINTLVGDGTFTYDADTKSLTTSDSTTITTDGDVTASMDTIFGGNGAWNIIFGDYNDVELLAGSGGDPSGTTSYTGGQDTITGGSDGADNDAYGDAQTPTLAADSSFTGGMDTFTGGANSSNTFYGDIFSTTVVAGASFTGGIDNFTGGAGGGNFFYGDADGIIVEAGATLAKGGNDILQGGANATNMLFGDVVSVSGAGAFQGGNDRLIAGAGGSDTLVGDWSSNPGGNGVGGDDTFVFFSGTGFDTIWDFEVAEYDAVTLLLTDKHDVVELNGFAGVNEFADIDSSFSNSGSNLVLTLGSDQIIFKGLANTTLTEDDFAFNIVV